MKGSFDLVSKVAKRVMSMEFRGIIITKINNVHKLSNEFHTYDLDTI